MSKQPQPAPKPNVIQRPSRYAYMAPEELARRWQEAKERREREIAEQRELEEKHGEILE